MSILLNHHIPSKFSTRRQSVNCIPQMDWLRIGNSLACIGKFRANPRHSEDNCAWNQGTRDLGRWPKCLDRGRSWPSFEFQFKLILPILYQPCTYRKPIESHSWAVWVPIYSQSSNWFLIHLNHLYSTISLSRVNQKSPQNPNCIGTIVCCP